MGDSRLVVEFGQLQAASGHIQAAIGKMQSQLSDLEQAAGPLVSSWDGQAKAAYDERQRKWSSAATELTTILNSIKKAVDESVADYMSTEKTAEGLF
jgi:6 kDa early secretory antigenic target